MPEMFGVVLFPAMDTGPSQQWYAHPRCIRDVMHPGVLGDNVRDEIQAIWTE
jgi:hypothetical protein